jgi:peptide/nickel transport system substrate-binding protein
VISPKSRRIVLAIGATALLLAACGGASTSPEPAPAPAPAPTAPAGPTDVFASNPGLDGCATDPNECNSGPRAEGGTLTWLVNQGHDGVFNVHRPEGGSVYLLQMMSPLFPRTGYFAPDGTWTWDFDFLAEEPTNQLVNDRQTMVFKIRPEAVWSDGTPITVDDFLWDWYHNSGDETQCVGCSPRLTQGYEDIDSIVGSDGGKTVTITLKEGVRSPEWFARYGSVSYPAHVSGADWRTPEGMGASSEYFLTTIPTWSAGPYVVESWDIDERAVFVPNPNWYGEITPSLDRLVLEVISDQPSWLPALANGEIDGGSPASFTPDLAAQFRQARNTYVGLGSAGGVWEHVDANTLTIPDVALRQAIFTAIDRTDARGRIFGELEPPFRNNHIFSQLSPYYVDAQSQYGYGSGDVAKARAILQAAGYTGFDGGTLTAPNGTRVPDLRFAFLASNTNRGIFVELAQSYLKEIGITVVPAPTPPADLGKVLVGGDYDLVIFGWAGSPLFTSSPGIFWSSTSGSNFGKYSNPAVDALLAQIPSQLDIAEAARITNEAVAIVMADAYVMPLWDTLNFMFVSDRLANVRDNHNTSVRSLYNVTDWGILAQ